MDLPLDTQPTIPELMSKAGLVHGFKEPGAQLTVNREGRINNRLRNFIRTLRNWL